MKQIKRIVSMLLILVLVFAAVPFRSDATELKTGIGIVNASALRLRAEPSVDSKVISTASRGDSVVIIRQVGDWYLVNFNLDIGYMHADYLTVKEKENVKLGYASFDVGSNVRSGPGTEYSVVKQAPKDETCFIIGFNCEWYKVSYNGNIGYVRSDLLTLLEKPYENAGSPGNTYHESSSGSSSSSSSDFGSRVVEYAKQYLGYRYVYGGSSPSSGFDCSGFTYYVYKQFGINIGRTATAQLYTGTKVGLNELRPGDVVLFERTYSTSSPASHAGIYIGNNQFIHASNSRTGVVISSLGDSYYASRFLCGRRYG